MTATLRAVRVDERLGERIRAARLRAHLSQSELGERVGVSQPTVAHWEKGVHAPKPPHMRAVAAVLAAPELAKHAKAARAAPVSANDTKRDYLSRPIHHVPLLDWPAEGRRFDTTAAPVRHHIPASVYAVNPFALVCHDPAMTRAFPSESVVVFDGADRTLADGAYHLVEIGGRFLIRRWREEPERLEAAGEGAAANTIFPKNRPESFGRALMTCRMLDGSSPVDR